MRPTGTEKRGEATSNQNTRGQPETGFSSGIRGTGDLGGSANDPFTRSPAPRDRPTVPQKARPTTSVPSSSVPAGPSTPATGPSPSAATSPLYDLPRWTIHDAAGWLRENREAIKKELAGYILQAGRSKLGSPVLFPRLPSDLSKDPDKSIHSRDKDGYHDTANNNRVAQERLKHVADRCGILRIRGLENLDNWWEHDTSLDMVAAQNALFDLLVKAIQKRMHVIYFDKSHDSASNKRIKTTVAALDKNLICQEVRVGIGSRRDPQATTATGGGGEEQRHGTEAAAGSSQQQQLASDDSGNSNRSCKGKARAKPAPKTTRTRRKSAGRKKNDETDSESEGENDEETSASTRVTRSKNAQTTPRATPSSSARKGRDKGGRKGETRLEWQ